MQHSDSVKAWKDAERVEINSRSAWTSLQEDEESAAEGMRARVRAAADAADFGPLARDARSGTARLGLSTVHISPQAKRDRPSLYSVILPVHGGLLRLEGPPQRSPDTEPPKRGDIVEFSWASRMRLIRQLACINRSKVESCLFVTLTYPGIFTENPVIWKAHLDTFVKRLRRTYEGVAGWWKLEPQKRWAPHYHLLLFGLADVDLDVLKAWVSKAWFEVVDSGDDRHLRAGTQVQRVRSWNGVMSYASKYLGKITKDTNRPAFWAKVGRWWGSFGKKHLPMSVVKVELTQAEFDQVKATLMAERKAAWVKARAAMIAKGIKVEERTNWEELKPDLGVTVFKSWDESLALLKQVIGIDLAGSEGEPIRPGQFAS